jgi:hypothetical protein
MKRAGECRCLLRASSPKFAWIVWLGIDTVPCQSALLDGNVHSVDTINVGKGEKIVTMEKKPRVRAWSKIRVVLGLASTG